MPYLKLSNQSCTNHLTNDGCCILFATRHVLSIAFQILCHQFLVTFFYIFALFSDLTFLSALIEFYFQHKEINFNFFIFPNVDSIKQQRCDTIKLVVKAKPKQSKINTPNFRSSLYFWDLDFICTRKFFMAHCVS